LYTLTSSRPEVEDEKDDVVKKKKKLMKDDPMTRATLFYSMKYIIVPLFEGHETAKKIIEALEKKYGPRSNTHIQL
jgi:hypothetical protein